MLYVDVDLVQQFLYVILLIAPECLGIIPVSFLTRPQYHYQIMMENPSQVVHIGCQLFPSTISA